MSDETIRRLARSADGGDPEALTALLRELARLGVALPQLERTAELRSGHAEEVFRVPMPADSSVGGTFFWTVSASGMRSWGAHAGDEPGVDRQVMTGQTAFAAIATSERVVTTSLGPVQAASAFTTGTLTVHFDAAVLPDSVSVRVVAHTSFVQPRLEIRWAPASGFRTLEPGGA